ncbi:unnamed protein product [Lampetra fluviatilis]
MERLRPRGPGDTNKRTHAPGAQAQDSPREDKEVIQRHPREASMKRRLRLQPRAGRCRGTASLGIADDGKPPPGWPTCPWLLLQGCDQRSNWGAQRLRGALRLRLARLHAPGSRYHRARQRGASNPHQGPRPEQEAGSAAQLMPRLYPWHAESSSQTPAQSSAGRRGGLDDETTGGKNPKPLFLALAKHAGYSGCVARESTNDARAQCA